ncbi:cysteine--tRNA ligase [Candidatus Peribacteria bacterium RIFCSPHIGHO2_02_FULL_52_16]|nr:MAG: cysteine--tRNA ligase [Candidatus Peribacteria bacterium RIFCSPHIGHO2_01_FULL_51_35]OGJ60720.1 MAG: cysteine--tRNA ligase [Candidatus Peribacteria bacterium RIFCSPHIGHO2_02_FULL_52_16]
MALKLYNTYSKKEEVFAPHDPKLVTMYTCGPTVYGRPHIGNYSSFLMADLLRRFLEVSGYHVKHVKNITDVGHLLKDQDDGEDKVEKQAREEKTDPLAIAKKYEAMYLEDEKALNMLEPAHRPRATENVPEMLVIIRELLEKGNAYETSDGVYFSVTSFPQYGALSGNTVENLNAGARVEIKEEKKHPADFALWKKCVGANAHHLLRWNFATGKISKSEGEDATSGFPGWHIECSAMSRKFLGEKIDLHTGGEDNIFPHHECEIAQSECSGQKPFVKLWLHKRRIDLGETKMSKSLGNVLTVPDIVSMGYSPLDLRYYLLSVHYRTQLKFTKKGLDDAHKARRKILEWMEEGGDIDNAVGKVGKESKVSTVSTVGDWEKKFRDAMESDLNTPAALAVVFDCMTWSRSASLSSQEKAGIQVFQSVVRKTFGCFEAEEQSIPNDVQSLLAERKNARAAKNFAASDRLRDQIKALGYEVRDEGGEQTVRRL